jgi:hypothetical protein
MDPLKLPIRQYQQQIVDSVRANPVTVVIGETGSGKTTQISQILEEAGFAEHGIIGVTQPRRVVSLAAGVWAPAAACCRCLRHRLPLPAACCLLPAACCHSLAHRLLCCLPTPHCPSPPPLRHAPPCPGCFAGGGDGGTAGGSGEGRGAGAGSGVCSSL